MQEVCRPNPNKVRNEENCLNWNLITEVGFVLLFIFNEQYVSQSDPYFLHVGSQITIPLK
jgi:hypothetical protein